MKAEEIKTEADVEKWLAELPPPLREKGCQVIAYRHSLRLLPFLVEYAHSQQQSKYPVLEVFRTFLLSFAHLRSEGPKPVDGLAAKVSSHLNQALSRSSLSNDRSEGAARHAVSSAFYLTQTLQTKNDDRSSRIRGQALKGIETGEAFASLDQFTINAAKRKTLDAVRYDAELFERGDDVLASPLWRDGDDLLAANWSNARAFFDTHPAWAVFRDFYERSISGEAQDWQLLIDLGCEPNGSWRGADTEVLDRIAEVVRVERGAAGATLTNKKSNKSGNGDTAQDASKKLADAIARSEQLVGRLSVARASIVTLLRDGRTDFDAKIEEINAEFNAQKELLREHIDGVVASVKAGFALEEPVELWMTKEKEHRDRASASYWWFVGSLIYTGCILVGMAMVIFTNASELLQAIAPIGCDPVNAPQSCSGFSFLGAVMIGLALTLFTLLLWFTRLKMKEYLSERHLALDARERRAFAEFYIGLLRQEGVDSAQVNEQRAIIYAALFRPTIDGIVKEEGGLDPALTAALSRFLAK